MMSAEESTEKSIDLLNEKDITFGVVCSRNPPTQESFN